MGYHTETKIQREEAYVNAHAAAVDRTINSKEYRLGTLSYVETGHIRHDHFWLALAKEESHDPAKFFAHNPQYVGFFTAPAKLGELPQNNVIFDVMKDRDTIQPTVFAAHHAFYVGMVNRDLQLEAESTSTPATSPLTTIPTTTSTPSIVPVTSTTVAPFSTSITADPGLTIITSHPTGTPGSATTAHGSGAGSSQASSQGSGSFAATGAVPEPASILLVAIGLVAAVGVRFAFSTIRKRRPVLA